MRHSPSPQAVCQFHLHSVSGAFQQLLVCHNRYQLGMYKAGTKGEGVQQSLTAAPLLDLPLTIGNGCAVFECVSI